LALVRAALAVELIHVSVMTSSPWRLRTVSAIAHIAVIGGAHAQAVTPEDPPPQTVVVRASADASASGLTPPYVGGQVARGSRLGLLGDQDIMSSPFSTLSFTNELIQDRQARSVGDVLLQDPAVRVARGFGNFQESYFIRGFVLSSDDMAYNGLYGLLPRQYVAAELFDRVEVLRGASAALNGAAPGGDAIGGSINLLPKRAPDAPLTEVTIGDASGAQRYVSADLARHFGEARSTGIRLTASHRTGGTGINGENTDTTVALLGFDWRSRNVRLSADIGHQDNQLERTRTNVTLATKVTAVPVAPEASRNWSQPWSFSNERDTFGTLRAEIDLSSSATTWIAAGARNSHEGNSLANLTLNDAASGAASTYRFDNTRQDVVRTGELGLRFEQSTATVKHTLVLSASAFQLDKRNAFATSPRNALSTNLFDPIGDPRPAFTVFGNDLASPQRTSAIALGSIAIADTMTMADSRVLLTVGERHQHFDIRNYAYGTGVESATYEKTRNSPFVAALFRASSTLSVFANYIESLAMGDTAPTTAANFGSELAPYVSKQTEVGFKVDAGRLGGSVSAFSTRRPRATTGADNNFGILGADHHQGLELTIFGMPAPTVRVLGGLTLLDARQRATGSAATDGKRVIGVPTVQGNIDVDFDVPALVGLSADIRSIATGNVYADAANTLAVPAWSRLDLGIRYVTQWSGRDITLRARVDNASGRRYWASSGGTPGSGYLVLGNPRTFTTSATFAF
jgi:iron complex outermembrane recepter protein